MRLPRLQPSELYAFLFILPVYGAGLDCANVFVEKTHFNLKPLGGPHSFFVETEHDPSTIYTNFTLDICGPLQKASSKDSNDGSHCKGGTNICAYQTQANNDEPLGIISIAGTHLDARPGNVKYTRLKTDRASPDRLEGVRIQLSGNIYDGRAQEAILDFRCNDKDKSTEKLRARRDEDNKDDGEKDGDEDDGDHGKREKSDPVDDGKGGTITYVSYGPFETNGVEDVLFVTWDTKYACEDREPDPEEVKKGWGFFTWLFVIVFLAAAAYLIFGSWLNYNRYGARGWDLLPHGDTIRDVPYILQDWGRKVVGTVQGGGSRGGYSAV